MWWDNVCCVSGEDGMLHLALGFGEGGVVEVMVDPGPAIHPRIHCKLAEV